MKRHAVAPTDEWAQLHQLATWPEQVTDELIRPVVLFGRSPAERARETGAPERTLYRQAGRFDQLGMCGLFIPAKVEQHRRIPGRSATTSSPSRSSTRCADTVGEFIPATYGRGKSVS